MLHDIGPEFSEQEDRNKSSPDAKGNGDSGILSFVKTGFWQPFSGNQTSQRPQPGFLSKLWGGRSRASPRGSMRHSSRHSPQGPSAKGSFAEKSWSWSEVDRENDTL